MATFNAPDLSRPAWAAFGDHLVARLRAQLAAQERAQRDLIGRSARATGRDSQADFSDAAEEADLDDLMDEQLRADALEALRSRRAGERPARAADRSAAPSLQGASPVSTAESPSEAFAQAAGAAAVDPALRLPHRLLTLTLRLAATFGSAAAFAELLRPGALTVIGDIEADRLGDFCRVLSDAGLPAGWSAVREPGRATASDTALLLAPLVHNAEVTSFGLHDMTRHIPEALETAAPVFVLLPRDLDPAHAPGPELPDPVPLSPLTSEILVEHLRHSHGAKGGIDAAALRAALPPDAALADLSILPLLRALREPTPARIGALLADICTPTPATASAGGISLADLAGLGAAKDLALHLVADLRAWSAGALPWSDVSRGLLLAGPPGTGKTELARAMAREAGLHLESGSFAEWQAAGHLGDMLAAMRKSFARAATKAPSVLFIDEIDAFGRRIGGRSTQNRSYEAKVIAALLQHLDGLADREGVAIVAACNHPDEIDPAITRAGRFDHLIRIGLPTAEELAIILRQHLGSDLQDVDLLPLARLALGRTGADCAAAVRGARGRARRNRRLVRVADLQAELVPALPDDLPAAARRRTAIHEAGHAIVTTALGLGEVVCLRLTATGGITSTRRRHLDMTQSDFHSLRAVHLAGRAAERLVFGAACAGSGGPADSDLAQATQLALAEELSAGLGSHGALWFREECDPRDLLLPLPTRALLQDRLAAAEDTARQILGTHRSLLAEIADALIAVQVLEGTAGGAGVGRLRPCCR